MTDHEHINEDDETREEPRTEEAPTHEIPPTTTADSTTAGGPRRLLRSRSDRMIAGVAGGLGRYFDVDPPSRAFPLMIVLLEAKLELRRYWNPLGV